MWPGGSREAAPIVTEAEPRTDAQRRRRCSRRSQPPLLTERREVEGAVAAVHDESFELHGGPLGVWIGKTGPLSGNGSVLSSRENQGLCTQNARLMWIMVSARRVGAICACHARQP